MSARNRLSAKRQRALQRAVRKSMFRLAYTGMRISLGIIAVTLGGLPPRPNREQRRGNVTAPKGTRRFA